MFHLNDDQSTQIL